LSAIRDPHSVPDLPGGDLVAAGLADLERGDESVAALVVSIGAPRLRRLGYTVPDLFDDPERQLYAFLAREDAASAHGRYNALIRRLVSFERAAESVR
jgi:hypothetical protein